jgi:hypothetical protein
MHIPSLGDLGTQSRTQSAHWSAGTALCARTVVDSGGEVLGSVVDLLLDLKLGRIGYAVVAIGGFMGIGARLVAVPWNALRPHGGQFMLLGGRRALDNGPAFADELWHRSPPRDWHESVHAHFHSRPYWEDARPSRGREARQPLPQ